MRGAAGRLRWMIVQERRAPPPPYQPAAKCWDEAFDRDGEVRPLYAELMAALDAVDLADLRRRVGEHAAAEGATFGGDEAFPVDPIPRLIGAAEWSELEAGL